MISRTYAGSPIAIGRSFGEHCAAQIASNIAILVQRTGYGPPPRMDEPMRAWISDQERFIAAEWPWYIDEMRGMAEGSKQTYQNILLLNLRIWQYDVFAAGPLIPDSACSSLAITLADGTVANIGSLDDPPNYYCGLVHIKPTTGLAFSTFPIAGTSWGNRGMNAAGLTLGVSSVSLPGAPRKSGTISNDISLRIILQTCATVEDVRAFCARYPFVRNLVCTDARGQVLALHQTTVGTFETAAAAPCALTNHVVDDGIMCALSLRGAVSFPESDTTRLRRGRLLGFAATQQGKATADSVRAFVADRLGGARCSICPSDNVVLTYCNPQDEPGALWVAAPQSSGNETWERHTL